MGWKADSTCWQWGSNLPLFSHYTNFAIKRKPTLDSHCSWVSDNSTDSADSSHASFELPLLLAHRPAGSDKQGPVTADTILPLTFR